MLADQKQEPGAAIAVERYAWPWAKNAVSLPFGQGYPPGRIARAADRAHTTVPHLRVALATVCLRRSDPTVFLDHSAFGDAGPSA